MQVMLDDLMTKDSDQDGLIEHENFPDFTFDAWMFNGPCVYTSCLWLGALYSFIEMSKLLGKHDDAERYDAVLQKAKHSFEEKFWNGELSLMREACNIRPHRGDLTRVGFSSHAGHYYSFLPKRSPKVRNSMVPAAPDLSSSTGGLIPTILGTRLSRDVLMSSALCGQWYVREPLQ